MPNDPNTAAPAAFKLEDLERSYFAPNDLASASNMLEQIKAAVAAVDPATGKPVHDILFRTNYDFSQPIPDGYGVLVQPIQKRSEDKTVGNVTVGVAVSAVPSIEMVMMAPDGKGEDFIQNAVIAQFAVKIGNAVRPKGPNNQTAGTLPFSLEDFIENQRGKESFKTYSEIAGEFIKILRGKGLKLITVPQLRQILMSQAFAETQYPKVPAAQWDLVLSAMIVQANKLKLEPASLINWKNTRYETTADETEIEGFEDIASLISTPAAPQAAPQAAAPAPETPPAS